MEHRAAQELFSDYIEGELAAEKQHELESHLQSCALCQKEFIAFKQTLRSLSGLQSLPAPQGFTSKVQQRIYRRSHGRFFRGESMLMRIPFEWISFILIIIMLTLYLIFMQGQVHPAKTVLHPQQEKALSAPRPKQ